VGGADRMSGAISCAWRDPITDEEMVDLVRSHGGDVVAGWWSKVGDHSLGWVGARDGDGLLVGFVNVAWDGADHAFLIDTKTRALTIAAASARRSSSSAWPTRVQRAASGCTSTSSRTCGASTSTGSLCDVVLSRDAGGDGAGQAAPGGLCDRDARRVGAICGPMRDPP
jgi:hypothetical protein